VLLISETVFNMASHDGHFKLQICDSATHFPFANKPFPIQVFLLDNKNQLVLGYDSPFSVLIVM
jgi:hypothetical protein